MSFIDTKKCWSCGKSSNTIEKFSCGHYLCYSCLKNILNIEQILQFKKSDNIQMDCSFNNNFINHCPNNGNFFYNITNLMENFKQINKRIILDKKIYSGKAKSKNKDIEEILNNISKNIKDKIHKNIEETQNKIDFIILYLDEAKSEYKKKIIEYNEKINKILEMIQFLFSESEIYSDSNYNYIQILKNNLNLKDDLNSVFKEQSDYILNYIQSEIKNIKNNNFEIESNNISVVTNNNLDITSSVFSIDEKSNFENNLISVNNSIWSLIELKNGVFISSNENLINIWKKNIIEPIQILKQHKSKINCLYEINENNDSIMFASGSSDNLIIIWKKENKEFKNIYNLIGHKTGINSMIQIKDKLISSSYEILIWDINDKFKLKKIIGYYKYPVTCLSNYDDLNGFFSGSFENIYIWNDKFQCKNILTSKGHFITCILYIYELQFIVSGGYDKFISIWKENQIFKSLEGHSNTIWNVYRIGDMKLISSSFYEIIVWNLDNFSKLLTISTNNFSLIKLKNGNFAYGSIDNKIKILNTQEYFN